MISDEQAEQAPPPDSTESPTLRRVDPARVVPHPANPRKDLGDLTDLQASIAEQGVLQPVVLLPADRVAEAWPQHADRLAGAELVVLMGHRRHAASLAVRDDETARATMPALVRLDAIADDPLAQLDAMTAENVARKALTPVEEARAFAEQAAAGRGQRAIATRAGCSQSHVSKRLKLLKLPGQMLREVEAGQLDVGDALVYVDKAAGDQFVMLAAYKLGEERNWWSAEQLVDEVRREQARRAEAEALAKKAAEQGLTLIDDPRKSFGYDYWQHRLDGKKAIARARQEGTLVGHIRPGGLDYYSTKAPKRAENRSEADERRLTDERERRRAMTARAEHAAMLAAKSPKLPPAAADIVDAWLWAPGNDVASLAGKWLTAAGVGPDPQLPAHQWWEQLRAADWPTRVHAAHALALARHEIRARTTWRSWTHEDAAWLARLAEHTGYTPTEWEQARLAAIDAAPAGREYRLVYDPTDSTWLLLDDAGVLADHDGIEEDDADQAKRWAAEVLADEFDAAGVEWTTRDDVDGDTEYVTEVPGEARGRGHPTTRGGSSDVPDHLQT